MFKKCGRSRESETAWPAPRRCPEGGQRVSGLRTLLPAAGHAALEDLSDICDEARQLRRQELLHHWLHDWLLLHIPLSLALILLGAVHAVMALHY